MLRFWESEFPQLKPVKSSTGQRMYRQRDVENVLRIKKLLYEEGFTIAGARQQLKAESKPATCAVRTALSQGRAERRPQEGAPGIAGDPGAPEEEALAITNPRPISFLIHAKTPSSRAGRARFR